MQNALFATLTTGVGPEHRPDKGVFDRLRTLPIARCAPLAGRILADTVKQAWAVALLLGVGALLGFRVGTTALSGLLGAFALLLIFSLAVSWIVVLVGVIVGQPGEGADLRLRGDCSR